MGRLADLRPRQEQPVGHRLIIDLRPLQEPDRAPITAAYLERLVGAYADAPLPGESVIGVLRALRRDPLPALAARGLQVAGRRWLPPTGRVLRSAGLALDSLLLRGAAIRTAGGTGAAGDAGGAARPSVVFHTAGGAAPVAWRQPVVSTLLDLAPWELPERYARTAASRLGHRLRLRTLTRAAAVLVSSRATAEAATRLLGLPAERLLIVPLAADPSFLPGGDRDILARLRVLFAIPERYLVVGGRYDARSDLPTVLAALAALRGASPAEANGHGANGKAGSTAWPPVLVLAGAAGSDDTGRTRVVALAEHHGVRDLLRLTPPLTRPEVAALEAGAVGHVQAALSDAAGLAALDALAAGVPVVASRTGPLPEIVGPSGIIVEPGDPGRMATALRALWSDGPVAQQVTRAARQRADGPRRTWADVAHDTRWAYAAALTADAVG